MNKTMKNLMKPIPVNNNSKAELRLRQEECVMEYLNKVTSSVRARDISWNGVVLPGTRFRSSTTREISNVLKRLEQKGKIISVLYGNARYYSTPVNGGEN